uniref:non-specific serine/threonine protein kinase n=1 Tax=Nelumbo nucifera TaxID=4432 RepID=A0A822Y5W0_NELNU|nr:TPA_asm: hypothetical protein HUJ06_029090 [Nelumbo nucifera]
MAVLCRGFFVFFLVLFLVLIRAGSGLNSDGEALLSLLKGLTVPPSIKPSWNSSVSTPCEWKGIRCDGLDRNVISLNMSGLGISGSLGPEIGLLRSLKVIDLNNNNFSGLIPAELSNCSLLEHLDLSENGFTGEVLRNIVNLRNLRYLSLYGNFLSGEIPESIGNCTKLQELYLTENQFVGALPDSLNNLKLLEYLDISSNSLEGRIRFGSGGCKNLIVMVLSYNQFDGEIPSSLGNCSRLTVFSALGNKLTGQIPSSFGSLTKLEYLYINENLLSGKIPPEIGSCSSLKEILLQSNLLEGEIPSELGSLSNLEDLELYTNRLTGEIPISIWKIPALKYLLVYQNNLLGELPFEMTELHHLENVSLFSNHFSGAIPYSLGINSSLVQLELTNNSFSGEIPPNLCFGKRLRVLNMGVNLLQGSIPSDVGSCSSLKRLILKHNHLTGPLPDFVQNSNLSFMDISGNNINGTIPSSLGNCSNLETINLSMNNLTGPIPQQIGNLVNLKLLNLSHNNLLGPLPPEISNCYKLLKLDLGFNSINGPIPLTIRNLTRLSNLILRENLFSEGIPDFFSAFSSLLELQLGGNILGGEIPPSIGLLQDLDIALNLSGNGLTGEIPSGMGTLRKLIRLDISWNNLTGNLSELGALGALAELNVSYNLFSDPIPDGLMKFLNSSPSSFWGNPHLCAPCLIGDGLSCNANKNISPCNRQLGDRKGLTRVKIAMIALGSLLFCLLVLVLFYCMYLKFRRTKPEFEISAKEGSAFLLSEIMEATDNLDHRFMIGKGAHGTVYKAALDPGRVYAVKKLVLSRHKGENIKSMGREIETVGKIKHRNLVRLEAFWLRKDNGLILYKYLENGNLHDVLHEIKPAPVLRWEVRYQIALGTAQGLAYLHDDCNPAIVHRDIKPNNILLDGDMEPHISDFGIAKLIDQSSATVQSITVAGTIGYISPETAFKVEKSKESDVYSYGVVLLELISRKRALDPSFPQDTDIVHWVRSIWRRVQAIDRIADPSLMQESMDSISIKEVIDVLLVALRCTAAQPSERPTMKDVVKQLVDAKARHRIKLIKCN